MRIAIVAESFLPDVNGVTNSVLRVVEHLQERGHEALVIAPGLGPMSYRGTPVERVAGVVLSRLGSISVGLPSRQVERALVRFSPDVVHLASPVLLGSLGLSAARRLGVPTVAVYQTDLPAFAGGYGAGLARRQIWSWLRRVHGKADVTLAPSQASIEQLRSHGVERVEYWPRGVDQDLFHPARHDGALRRRWSPDGRLLVGYVGRLAPEKEVHLLAGIDRHPEMQLVIVGDGPARTELEAALPDAVFHGFRSGTDLAASYASLDVFVHTGCHETFCQSLQEALASGIPAVAPAAGGPLDLVSDGVNGLLWDPRDADTIVDQVERLLADGFRHQLGEAARRSVEKRTWSAIGDELVGHYEWLTALAVNRGAA